ncbi:MAG TPA: insulinase family protein [Deltaproteobacteria bacterium]|nr:insulinase family protein [Deltaproteobacteria bacterium]
MVEIRAHREDSMPCSVPVHLGLLALLLAGCPKATSDPLVEASDPLAQPLPVDPGVRSGVLDNGLRWYIEVNHEPAERAVLRLAVDAGSVLEDDDQLGLAHFVEHMAFNGTEHFPGNELITYLESVGTKFGPHLNAHTSFDETVYKLTVPTDDPQILEQGLLVLSDWAGSLTFDSEEIDRERGVVLEEWRTRLGPQERIWEQTLPKLYFGSPYPERLPIGTEASLKGFEHDAARRFYADWYRPDLMAVVVVGDIDPDAVQAQIEEKFGGLVGPAAPRERTRPTIPSHDDVKHTIVADPEVPRASLQILAKVDMPQGTTHGDYRESLLQQVGFAILNERLGELARQPQAPFLSAGAGKQQLNPTEGAWFLGAAVPDTGTTVAYRALLTEIERLRRHGVRPGELERAKASVLTGYERYVLEKDKTSSTRHAQEIVRVFLTGEPMPGITYEAQLAERYVPAFTVEELSTWAASEWMPDTSRVVNIVMPAKEGLAVPTAEDLVTIEAEIRGATIEAPPPEEAVGELLASLPEPGSVTEVHTEHLDGLGFTGWTLSNGVQVWSRDTDFKEDEIRIGAFSPGGSSLVSDDDYVSAALATEVAQRSGFGQLDATELIRWSAGHTLSVSRSLGEAAQSLSASASVVDLERALQLIHAGFVAPRFSDDGLELTRTQHAERLRNRTQDPNTHFYDAFNALAWPDDPRRAPWTVETLDELDGAVAERIYREHFGDASGWTFVVVGNLPDDFEALITRYVASLPASAPPLQPRDRGIRPAPGRLEAVVRKGLDPKARVRIEYHGDLEENTWLIRNRLFAMSDILSVLLREELREERGGVYGVSVRGLEHHQPWDHYSVSIQFMCDPERVDELVGATEQIVATLRTDGPEASYVSQEQEKNRREREENLRKNGFWLSAFSGALRRGADPAELLTWDDRNDSLSVEVIAETAASLLDEEQRVKVVLLPGIDEAG